MHLQALILPLVLFGTLQAQTTVRNHARLLAKEWRQATERVEARREVWGEVFASLDADAVECEAIIFPELLRYSRLQDGMEQAALHALYVDGGKERANFSIGVFQMKPSFAEEVETAWMDNTLRHKYKLYFDCKDRREARRRRLLRLKDERWQCVYLAVFVRLMLEREPGLASLPPEERIALLATAYNYRFQAPMDTLRQNRRRRTFHLDFLPGKGTAYYAYADIAVEWYGVRTNKIKEQL